MSKVLSGHLRDEIYRIIEEDADAGGQLCIDELTEKIATLFDDAHVGLCGNLSDGFTVSGIYDGFDDAATCLEGVESWIMGCNPDSIEESLND